MGTGTGGWAQDGASGEYDRVRRQKSSDAATSGRHRLVRGLAVAVVLVLAVPVLLLTDLGLAGLGRVAPCARSAGTDALWLGHAWVDGRRSVDDVRSLAAGLATTGVRDVFVHVGPLEDDGTLDPGRRPEAEAFLDALGDAEDPPRAQAWIGNVLGADGLDLADASTRDAVVAAAAELTAQGWQGVHLNVEPIADGDADYLTLLDELAASLPDDVVLSVAAEPVEPRAGLAAVADAVREPLWWSGSYLAQVGGRVDQVAVMAYDTALPTEGLYAGFVRRQADRALDAVPDDVDLLVGVPAYHTDDVGHREAAETVAAAVRGTRLAVGGAEACGRGVGVALYVDFDATAGDWASYCTDWVGRSPAGAQACGDDGR